jgi:hypothetical protein
MGQPPKSSPRTYVFRNASDSCRKRAVPGTYVQRHKETSGGRGPGGSKRGEGAVAGAQEAVGGARAEVESRDCPLRVDSDGFRECGARGIKRGEGAGLCDEGPGFGRGVRARGCLLS